MESQCNSKYNQTHQILEYKETEAGVNDMNNLKLNDKTTLNLIIIGMAGSGKTTFVKKLEEEIVKNLKEAYIINMDPAVHDTLYEANLDIRDTIKYKEVMISNGLGPNGAIMTCLNLFATNIHKIIELLENKKGLDYIVIDTPGQLEVFSWSASGKLISDSFSLIYPTILIYLVDIPRCSNPNTFASNMLYALSIMYKMKLPLLIVFNKKDIVSETQCFEWISDYDAFQVKYSNLRKLLTMILTTFHLFLVLFLWS
jgi:GTPase SAR1 family protein